jgi:hypothetical protein
MAEMTPAPGCNGTTMRTITPGSGKEITKGSTATVHATGVVKESGARGLRRGRLPGLGHPAGRNAELHARVPQGRIDLCGFTNNSS